MSDAYMLKEQLSGLINNQALLRDLQITHECDRMFQQMIDIGIERIILSEWVDQQTHKVLAEKNLLLFLDSMENQARKSECYPVLDNKIFETVQYNSTPLWPYKCLNG